MTTSEGGTPPGPKRHRRGGRGRAGAGLADDPEWYKDAVIYEVRTRSFFDSNGDGVGDIAGLTSKLDYLADLGITALWLLPHYPSPGRDDGYDIADYTDIHPDIGTLADFDELVAQAHRRGIRIITELVLNHTSDQHPWFQRARRAPPGSPERAFYVWSDTPELYKDARIIFRDFEPSNWTFDHVAKSYFWHRFFAHQPDLNFENPAVHEAMFGVVDFWMARGVDGLRLDAVPYLYERDGTSCENLPETHAFLKKLRAHVDAKFPGRMLLAEANQWPEDAAAYFGAGDECHMNFHFPIMPRLFMSIHMEDRFPIIDILKQTPELPAGCQWAMFLRNHDELTLEMVTDEERDYMYRVYAHESQMRINLGIRRRLAPLTGNDRRRMELLNGLLFSMPGTPVIYYGDEIGMGDNVYLGDRNGVRTPMQWSADRNAGFSRANPQRLILPIIIDPEYHYEALNVEAQQSTSSSLLWWTKRLIALRKRFRAFGRGSVEFLHPANPRVLAFVRRFEDELVLVVANLSRHVQYVELDLAAMKGLVPVEAMGQTRFPAVGDGPYMLTLGGHDFYWFSLEAPRGAAQEQRMSDMGPVGIGCASADELLFGADRPALEDALPAYLDARGWLDAGRRVAATRIVESVRLPRAEAAGVASAAAESEAGPIVITFVRIDYTEGEGESFALPMSVVPATAPGAPFSGGGGLTSVIAHLSFHQGPARGAALLVEAAPEAIARAVLDAVSRGATLPTSNGFKVTGVTDAAGAPPEGARGGEASSELRVLASDRLGAAVAAGSSRVVRFYYRMEEGTAPELEVGRYLAPRGGGASPRPAEAAGSASLVPRVAGALEYRAPRAEPVTLALVEDFVANEGTAWEHARGEVRRAYERVLARPEDASAATSGAAPPPEMPSQSLVDLAYLDPAGEHRELIAGYRDFATQLGKRTADLHLALASSREPAFEPQEYSMMHQRSKYQTARNLVGRVLASLGRELPGLPPDARPFAEQVLASEARILECFEPLLTQRIDAMQIRRHGDLHLGRVLFTGKDFVFIGLGGGRDTPLSERRRKSGALRDVAGMLRSFHYAAATSLRALRPEDQERAEPWAWLWPRWASAAFVRGYLDGTKGAPFVPSSPSMTSMLIDVWLLQRAFGELGGELARRPEMAIIPLQAILRMIGVTLPA